MKIEKINENQIRCTLTKQDLAERQIKLSELAYGTEKVKSLFRDMMQQASFEFGFDAEDIPLMIEAIPLNSECIVLVITKVEDPEELDTSVIKALKLDTSAINASEPGTYTYTIQFKKKKYNGTFTIKEKELPQMQFTLKEISIPKGTALSSDLSTYVVQTLTDEVKNNTTLDLSNVNAAQVGIYQYTVSYNGQTYVSTINVYNQTVITPNTPEVKPNPETPTTSVETPATEEKKEEPVN
jgi:negative regulator of genetic competence, sporulation and motility